MFFCTFAANLGFDFYSDKTFIVQADYDYMFGNISWQDLFLFYNDAEQMILNHRKVNPYDRDPSYISISSFKMLVDDETEEADQFLERIISAIETTKNDIT